MQKTHIFEFSERMRFTCKKCRKCFNRNFALFSEKDKFCDFCNEKFIITGETPESKIVDETKYILDACFDEIIDNNNPWFAQLEDLHKENLVEEDEENAEEAAAQEADQREEEQAAAE